jgi:nucleotide-binding universal stress UspA family protein
MNRILVPVDFSDTSVNALNYAIQLFKGFALEVTLLHSYEVSSSAFTMKSINRVMEDDAHKEMDALIKNVERDNPNVVFRFKIMKINAISAITSLANSNVYDFVIMGTKGASGLKEVFIGSVAGGVISRTHAPVIVVPNHFSYDHLHEIVFASSGAPLSDNAVLEPLRALAKMHSSSINILHISKEAEPDLNETVSALEDFNPTVTYDFGSGNINDRLKDYFEKKGASLLCLVRGKKDFISRIFGESVTMKQTFDSSVPLLILHD